MPRKNLDKRLKKLERTSRARAPEVRFLCVPRGPTAVPTAGSLIEMTNCPVASRQGEQIRPTKYINKNHIVVSKNPTYDVITVRLLIARSKAGTVSSAIFPSTVYNCPDYDLLEVLHDQIVELNASAWDGTNYSGFVSKSLNFFKKYKKGIPALYNNLAGTSQNGVYQWLIADVAGATFEGYNTMFYTDI